MNKYCHASYMEEWDSNVWKILLHSYDEEKIDQKKKKSTILNLIASAMLYNLDYPLNFCSQGLLAFWSQKMKIWSIFISYH